MKTLLALTAAAAAVGLAPVSAQTTAGAPAAQTYRIELYSYGYRPDPIQLRAGVPVTMVFTNTSGIGHSFKSQAFFRTAQIRSGMVHDGEVHVMPHHSMSVTLVPARGTYPVHCSHFFHDQLGMHTYIYVQ